MVKTDSSDGQIPTLLLDINLESIFYIFKKIFGTEPRLKGKENRESLEEVLAIVSFTGDIDFIIMLSLPKNSAIAMSFNFCGVNLGCDNPDIKDMVGELANILGGDIVSRMAKKGLKITMSLPTTFLRDNSEGLLPIGAPLEKLHFSMVEGDFIVNIAMTKLSNLVVKNAGK